MLAPARAMLSKLRYMHRLYGGMREARRAWTPDGDMAALPFPQLLQIQTLNACQAACVMCPWPVFRDLFARGRMEEDLFDRIAEEVASRQEARTFVPMLQNEPFLDKRLFDRIARFRRVAGPRVEVELVTNGAFLTDEAIAQIREVELDVLDISLDALSRETYARIRKGLDYDAVIAGVERVLAADLPRTKVFVRLVRQAENASEVRAFTRSWEARGVSVFVYTANNRGGAVTEFDRGVGYQEAAQPAPVRLARRAGRAAMRSYIGGCCPVPFATANILHDGTMLLCVHDWARKEVIGNIRESSIADLWNGERMREIRQLMVQRRYDAVGPCSECTLARDGWV